LQPAGIGGHDRWLPVSQPPEIRRVVANPWSASIGCADLRVRAIIWPAAALMAVILARGSRIRLRFPDRIECGMWLGLAQLGGFYAP
jgi:hypothetical protein